MMASRRWRNPEYERARELNETRGREQERAARAREIRKNLFVHEAKEQGCLLSYKDLHLILLSSLATLKRDISYLRKHGVEIFIKNGLRAMRSADCRSNG